MNFGEIVTGRRSPWNLLKQIGEGDAGEVYLVESLLDRKPAILKRPHRTAFSGDVLRQAGQINQEGQILIALEGLLSARSLSLETMESKNRSRRTKLRVPALIDQSQAGSQFGEALFIVIEQASGVDLATLARMVRFGKTGLDWDSYSPETQALLERAFDRGKVPSLVLLRALAGLTELFEKIHFGETNLDGNRYYGVIWNDVKPEHIFWDPDSASVMVIDWGNGQFLDADGASRDRRASRLDDYVQFLQEMGSFLAEVSPKLYRRLEWPEEVPPSAAFSEGIKPLRERIAALLSEVIAGLEKARRRESDLASTSNPKLQHIDKLGDVQGRIQDFGETPDQKSSLRLHAALVAGLAAERDLDLFLQVCARTRDLPAALASGEAEKWDLLGEIARLAQEMDAEGREGIFQALESGITGDWPSALWKLHLLIGHGSVPAWWETISERARRLHLQIDSEIQPPSVAVTRLYYTLQAAALREESVRSTWKPVEDGGPDPSALLRSLEENVVKKWKLAEPDPPNSGIDYSDLDGLLDAIEAALPGAMENLDRSLEQPRAQAHLVMDAWRRKEFETARRGLRLMLLWDPHRRRLLLADRAMQNAPNWLLRVRSGARPDEPFQDFLTQVELAGRELRNQVGPARWLDLVLDTLKQIRNGARPADLIIKHPEILNEVPWLNEYQSRETLSLPHALPLSLERKLGSSGFRPTVYGVREGILAPERDLSLNRPLDTWLPEARGSSARVFLGQLKDPSGQPVEAAIKLMRPDRADYALPLFREEVQILSMLRDLPGINPLLECGFINLDQDSSLPPENGQAQADFLRGVVLRYGIEEVQNFLVSLDTKVGQGWVPYLALEKRSHEQCLMVFCDAGYTHGRFLPLSESLLLAIQICDLLQVVHDRNIVYRDHKILHYYWDPETQGVVMLDWNIARHSPQGLSPAERRFDLVQFGARALHHILTGRSAPGALPLGPNRPDEIEHASLSYHTQWTYDDERLPNRIKEILTQVLAGGYEQLKDLRQDLYQVYQKLVEAAPEASSQQQD